MVAAKYPRVESFGVVRELQSELASFFEWDFVFGVVLAKERVCCPQ